MKTVLACILLLAPLFSFAGSNFDEGVKAFQDSNYVLAIEKFQASLAETPNDVASYYNLGLAHTEAKQFGKAIWSFEKVLKLSPADSDAKDKIIACYAQLNPSITWEPRLNRLKSALYGFSGTTWSILAIVFSCLLAIFTLFFFLMKEISYKRLFIALGFVSFCGLISSLLISYGATNYAEQTRFAVVTKTNIPTYKNAQTLNNHLLKEGDQLEILDDNFSDKTLIQVTSKSGDTYLVKAVDVDFV